MARKAPMSLSDAYTHARKYPLDTELTIEITIPRGFEIPYGFPLREFADALQQFVTERSNDDLLEADLHALNMQEALKELTRATNAHRKQNWTEHTQ